MARDRYDVNELLERAKKQREELSKIERLLSSRERRFYRAFLVTIDEQQSYYLIFYAIPMTQPVVAKTVINHALETSDYFKDIWITEDSSGNLIGYGFRQVWGIVETDIPPIYRHGAPQWGYVPVPRETEKDYQEALENLKRDKIIIELTDLIIEQVENLYQIGEMFHDRLREIEERRYKAIEKYVPQPQASIYTGGWWEVVKKDAQVCAMLKNKLESEEQAKRVMAAALAVVSLAASLPPLGWTGFLMSSVLVGAGTALSFVKINELRDKYLPDINKELVKIFPEYNPFEDASFTRTFYGGYENLQEAQRAYGDLRLDYRALEKRNNEIAYFSLFIKDLAVLSWWKEVVVPPEGLGEATSNRAPLGELGFEKIDQWSKGQLKINIGALIELLLDQPNPLIMAYELAKEKVFPDVVDEEKNKELKSVLSEYVDQSYWRLVPDVRAIYTWARVLNLDPGQFKLIAPDEDFIRLKKVTYHPLIAELKQWINFSTGGDPGTEWLNMYYQKLLSESKNLELGGALQEQSVSASILAAAGYGAVQGAAAAVASAAAAYTKGAEYSRVGGEVPSIPYFPVTGYGAGFLGMPSGGEVATTSGEGTTTASRLSLPSFPSISLPSMAGGPSALPSPVGLEGVVGGVPSIPSSGLPSVGWGGAAMPASSIVPVGWDGAMAPGGYFLGGLKQLVAGQEKPRGGFSPAWDLGAFLLAPFKNLLSSQRPSAPGSRGGRLMERLFQIPLMLLTGASPAGPSLAAEQLGDGLFARLFGPRQPPISAPQIVHRFEKGSVQIHTQKIDAKTLGNAFISFLAEQSRQ